MHTLHEIKMSVDKRRVAAVRLLDFRNYGEMHVELGEGLHVVAGSNAQGKTNFLESLYLLSTTRLLRGMRDAEAVRDGAERALVEADLGGGSSTIGIKIEKGVRKRATLNGMGLPRAADLIGRLVSVCVSSADLPIVAGEPADRRLYLDLELSQLHPGYLRALTQYRHALEQRNALLKQAQEQPIPPEAFEVWEIQMAEHGAAMRSHRSKFIAEVARHAAGIHSGLGNGEKLGLIFIPKDDAPDQDALLGLYLRHREAEIARGTSSVGPHRDDVLVTVDGREARVFGSQGQQRCAVISLKLATHEHMREELGESPLLLLDDMLSDLDADRRARLCEWVAESACQAILTCTEPAAAGERILSLARIFHVSQGAISQ